MHSSRGHASASRRAIHPNQNQNNIQVWNGCSILASCPPVLRGHASFAPCARQIRRPPINLRPPLCRPWNYVCSRNRLLRHPRCTHRGTGPQCVRQLTAALSLFRGGGFIQMNDSPFTDKKFVLQTFAKLGWVVWALAMSATTGNSWIGDSDGAIEHFGVRGNLAYSSACARDILTPGWCSTFHTFVVLQTVAALLCSLAMAGLIVAGGRGDSPSTVHVAGCTFLAYALAQLTTTGVVVALTRNYDQAFRARESWSSSSWYVLDLRYGVSFWSALAAASLGFVEAAVLLTKARSCSRGHARHRLAQDDGGAAYYDDHEEAASLAATLHTSCFPLRYEASRVVPP